MLDPFINASSISQFEFGINILNRFFLKYSQQRNDKFSLMVVVIMSAQTLYSMDIPFMAGMASLIAIHFDGNIMKANVL